MLKGKPKLKTATLNLRIDPTIKLAAEKAAQQAHRSVTNFVEVLIIEHCQNLGIALVSRPESLTIQADSYRGGQHD